MKQEELTVTFMIISNWKKKFSLHGLYISCKVLMYFFQKTIFWLVAVVNGSNVC